jgi:glycosyltransferase involved in cell wall biosynthesis
MKVLMVIAQFYPIVGGAEKQAQLLAKKLMEKGVDVKIVTGWWRFKTPPREVVDGVHVTRNFSCWGMFGIKGLRFLGGLMYMVSLGIYLLAHKRDYDIIHVHQALYPAFVSALCGKELLHKPVIVKIASSGRTSDIRQLKRYPLGALQLKYLLKKMDCLVAVNRTGGDEFEEIGYAKSQIVHIPNGVIISSNMKNSYDQVKCVVATARLSEEKGIDVLLRAWSNVVQGNKGASLTIIGGGPLERVLKGLSQYLGIVESVKFVGVVKNVSQYLKNADLFVLPSRSEGVSNALLEAMSYGVPCIATNVGGNPEVLKMGRDQILPLGGYAVAKSGVLVNPDDTEGLSEAILYLIREGKVREEIGRGGRAFVQDNYSIDSIADRYITLYRRILEEKS